MQLAVLAILTRLMISKTAPVWNSFRHKSKATSCVHSDLKPRRLTFVKLLAIFPPCSWTP